MNASAMNPASLWNLLKDRRENEFTDLMFFANSCWLSYG